MVCTIVILLAKAVQCHGERPGYALLIMSVTEFRLTKGILTVLTRLIVTMTSVDFNGLNPGLGIYTRYAVRIQGNYIQSGASVNSSAPRVQEKCKICHDV